MNQSKDIPQEIIEEIFELFKQKKDDEAKSLADQNNISESKFQDLSTIYFWGWEE